MEEKINIAEILKDKPQGTKLYNRLYNIDVELDTIVTTGTGTTVWSTDKTNNNDICYRFYSEFGTIRGYPDGLQILSPSKEMRDWSKFTWKKGDVLVSNDGNKRVVFNGFTDDTYALFKAKHGFEVLSDGNTMYLADEDGIATSDYTLEDNDAAQTYINTIEERLGGKMNMETLEVEKPQAEFKDGDIVVYGKLVAICRKIYKHTLCFYVSLNEIVGLLFDDEVESSEEYRLATEEEKQQLFDALAKEGKAWNAEKKAIVDLPKKCEFKPMDWCLMRDIRGEECFAWSLCQFAYQLESGRYEAVGGMRFDECIPYNESTKHLLGTTDEWKGGEQ